MEASQVLELLKLINGAYSRFVIKEDTANVWYEMLKNEDYEKVMKTLTNHIRTSRFEPTISDLIPQQTSIDNRIRLQQEAERHDAYSHPTNL